MSKPEDNGAVSEQAAFAVLEGAVGQALDRLTRVTQRAQAAETKNAELSELVKRFTGDEGEAGRMLTRPRADHVAAAAAAVAVDSAAAAVAVAVDPEAAVGALVADASACSASTRCTAWTTKTWNFSGATSPTHQKSSPPVNQEPA